MERYKALNSVYYRDAVMGLIVFDYTNHASLQAVETWKRELITYANPAVVFILIGNKADLAESAEVEDDEARAIAEENNMFFIKTSATTGEGTKELVEKIFELVPVLEQEPSPQPAKKKSCC